MYRIFFFITISFLLSACSNKITVKSLYPSKVNVKISTLKIENFENDDISQTSSLREKIFNKIYNHKKIFKISNKKYDAILKGKVLKSTVNSNTYYERYVDYSRCKVYAQDEVTKRRTCIEYYVISYPCEDQEYIVKTQIELLTKDNLTIFMKTYKQNEFQEKCYRNTFYLPHFNNKRDMKKINPQLANKIAENIVNDLAPHYKYFKVEIVDTLEEKNYTYSKKQKMNFKRIISFMKNNQMNLANKELEILNKEINSSSWEVLYNLALSYESLQNLEKANLIYKEAKLKTGNFKNLDFLSNAINRTNKNIKKEEKAKLQLK